MKILCVTDSFGSGGAQRQLVNLACGLREKGHVVEAFVYHPHQDFFKPDMERAGIPIHSIQKRGRVGLKVLFRIIKLLRSNKYDAVISFLDTPSVYVALASLFVSRTRVIVSERSSYHHDKNRFLALGRRILYGAADRVVANSMTQAEWLRRYPWLSQKTVAIYNGFPLNAFLESEVEPPPLRFIVIGRIGPEKNGIRLVEALELFRKRHGYVPEISWVGKEDILPSGQRYVAALYDLLEQHPEVRARWRWLGERRDVIDLLRGYRALIHPSLYEGLPNVVCEALLSGRPVLASNVCDHPLLVSESERGFLFDPQDSVRICEAIEKMVGLSSSQWVAMSRSARRYGLENLGMQRMVSDYEKLCAGL